MTFRPDVSNGHYAESGASLTSIYVLSSIADVFEMNDVPLEEFTRLAERLMRHLLNHAVSILHSEDLAWDAVQEALLSLWNEVKAGGKLPDHAGPWLCRAVVHRSLHLSRMGRRRTIHERRACTVRSGIQEPDPATSAEDRELQDVLDVALTQIPDVFRQVFIAHELRGIEYAQIATELRISIGTVRSRLSRAREQLQKILESAVCDFRDPAAQTQKEIVQAPKFAASGLGANPGDAAAVEAVPAPPKIHRTANPSHGEFQ